LKRAEKEALERAEEEERKLKKKKEEEEFTKIPDDTMNLTQNEPAVKDTPGEGKSKKRGKGKKKGNEDNIVEPNGMGSDDFNKKEKEGGKKRRNK